MISTMIIIIIIVLILFFELNSVIFVSRIKRKSELIFMDFFIQGFFSKGCCISSKAFFIRKKKNRWNVCDSFMFIAVI